MPAPDDVESTTLPQRLVLLALVELDDDGATPANPVDVMDRCRAHVRAAAPDVAGEPSEAEVARALNELAASDLVAQSDAPDDSPVGKGRPAYAPSVDRAAVVAPLDEDERLADVVERVR